MKMISVLQNSSLKCLWKSERPLRITDFGLNPFLSTFIFLVQRIALSRAVVSSFPTLLSQRDSRGSLVASHTDASACLMPALGTQLCALGSRAGNDRLLAWVFPPHHESRSSLKMVTGGSQRDSNELAMPSGQSPRGEQPEPVFCIRKGRILTLC